MRGRKVRRRLCPVRRRLLLPQHRGDDVPGLRQARAERTDHLFLPDHRLQLRERAGLSDPRALSVRQVLLQVLQERRRQRPHGVDDLCRPPIGTAAALTALLTGKPPRRLTSAGPSSSAVQSGRSAKPGGCGSVCFRPIVNPHRNRSWNKRPSAGLSASFKPASKLENRSRSAPSEQTEVDRR